VELVVAEDEVWLSVFGVLPQAAEDCKRCIVAPDDRHGNVATGHRHDNNPIERTSISVLSR